MLVVGLTGGIACGKSTVSRRLQEKHKLPVVDADKIARDIVQPGERAFNEIVIYFKDKIPDLLLEDGHLNRPALGKWVFADKDDLKLLNGITHPQIRLKMLEQLLKYYIKGYRMCVLDVPLLFEGKLDMLCGITLSVTCDEETQLERLQVRNPDLSMADARNRINSQMPMAERRAKSDYVIENNGPLQDLYKAVDSIVTKIQPSALRTLVEYFPPFGAVSATAMIASKYILGRLQEE
ncbi:putative dephospho-CoA kinase KNAG_0A04640 [Huiozyma naganishii CBS 8797]|uniref:Dephospho-CoA kinase n=1 Tax=Huiozyma naganishii (strain ATCC MYA-139 / BCRC 22969 / CBS 8797 / KCTC 17520 / NBRC 10181 / NCYC 3082 / Yp74L-3) TaxID=1071383 RepID=J7S3R3_HUIN7|nr:hypothetical protein KNAG_0A04640 [Kazachstania naganishii CBS 8797]CCK68136.1 hypothetical protein KNAG_0A04640 [Kazachstania naganishii CBS 8797]